MCASGAKFGGGLLDTGQRALIVEIGALHLFARRVLDLVELAVAVTHRTRVFSLAVCAFDFRGCRLISRNRIVEVMAVHVSQYLAGAHVIAHVGEDSRHGAGKDDPYVLRPLFVHGQRADRADDERHGMSGRRQSCYFRFLLGSG